MRVEASKVLAQTVRNRNPIDLENPPDPPINVSYGRASKIEEIVNAAVDFATNFLLEFELPSMPHLRVGNIRGFENTNKVFCETVGVIEVNTSMKTKNAHVIRMTLAIPFHKGKFQAPSIAIYKDKKRVFSQDLIDNIVESIETNKPIVSKPLDPSAEYMHEQNIERPMYSAPNDPTSWSVLLTERY